MTTAAARTRDVPRLLRDGSNAAAVIDALTEAVQTWRGYRGDPLDQTLTRRDALAAGLVDASGRLRSTGGGTTIVYPGGPGGAATEPDLTPPPTPTGLSVTAGISNLYISCDQPTYTQGHGHDRTIVYGAKWPRTQAQAPTFADAVRLWDFLGPFTAYPTEPATRWCIWIKWQTVDGVQSSLPAGGINGAEATTSTDVSLQVEALTGQIRESNLYAALANKINSSEARTYDVAADILTTALGTHRVEIQRIEVDQYLGAQYGVRALVTSGGRTLVGGFGLSGTASDEAGPSIDFGVLASRFWIGAPVEAGADLDDIMPFIVQTVPTTINGVEIPRGVYMDAAYITNLTAMVARLGRAWIDDAMVGALSASKLTAGDGTIGGNLKSSNFASGSTGWLLQPNGNAEFGFQHVRGTLLAGQVAAGYITTPMLAAGAVVADAIAAGAVTTDKLSARAITTEKIVVGAITSAYTAEISDSNTFNVPEGGYYIVPPTKVVEDFQCSGGIVEIRATISLYIEYLTPNTFESCHIHGRVIPHLKTLQPDRTGSNWPPTIVVDDSTTVLMAPGYVRVALVTLHSTCTIYGPTGPLDVYYDFSLNMCPTGSYVRAGAVITVLESKV